MTRKLFYLPAIIFIGIAISKLFVGNGPAFFIWLLGAVILVIAFWPFAAGTDEKTVPILQMFLGMLAFMIFLGIAIYFDTRSLGFDRAEALLSAVLGGFGVVALIMLLKGGA